MVLINMDDVDKGNMMLEKGSQPSFVDCISISFMCLSNLKMPNFQNDNFHSIDFLT